MAIGFFDGNKADASPESIKRKRAMIARLMQTGRAPRDVGEGLNAIGQGLQAAVLGSRADAAEQASNASSAEAFRNIYSGFGSPMASAGNPVATGSGATRMSRGGPVDPAIRDGIATTASSLGIDPVDLATAISYETGGTFDPTKRGPTTQWGQHKGLIQFGQPQARQHGVDWNNPVGSQLGPNGAVASYLRSTGVKPGMGLLDIYSAINAGGVGRYNRSDANNGGAPGTVRDKVEQQMAGHRARAMAMFQPPARPVQTASAGPQSNDAQMQDGAGELQAGGSEMMGGGYNPFLPRDMAPTADAMGQGIADNEEQTRMMEAQMAAEQGLPYAGNEPGVFNQSDVFSPVPMGLGPNPFLPREPDAMAQAPAPMLPQMDRATFDQVTAGLPQRAPAFTGQQAGLAPSWAGDPDKLAPGAEQASFVIPARDTVALPAANNRPPQSPFVPPAMRAPLPVDMGGENSGGSAMQFIESEFARREGRPDPRMAIGAPQGYNPFVQQPTQAPQMPAGGGSVQGVSQGDTMAGNPAQAPAQASNRIAYLASVAGNSMNNPEVRQLAMAEIQTERARAQAEADRARTQAASDAALREAGLPTALSGNPVVLKGAVDNRFAKPEPATSDQRELVQVNRERQAANLPPLRMDEWKTQKARAGATSVNVNTGSKADEKFSEAFAKGDADALGTIATAGMAARRNVSRIDRLEALINENPTGGVAALQQRAGEFGINTKGLSGIQAAQALINSLVPEQRQPGSGPMSDADLALFKESLPRIINQPDGNRRIINTMRGIANYDAEGAVIVQQLRENKINRAQAFEALQNRVNPLAEFSQPPARTGQPSQAEIEAEMKRRGLR
jgi:hypothetical protein